MPKTPNSLNLTLEEKEKINALSADGKTPNAIGKELNRSPHTIRAHLKTPEAQERIETIKKELADIYEDISRRMLASITEADITKINAYQRTISSGIATDKMRLLRGESTQNIDVHALQGKLEDIRRQKAEIAARIEQLTGKNNI